MGAYEPIDIIRTNLEDLMAQAIDVTDEIRRKQMEVAALTGRLLAIERRSLEIRQRLAAMHPNRRTP